MKTPWAKLWWSWYSSRAHIGLSGYALAIGPAVMVMIRASAARVDSDGDMAWLRDQSGKPITVRAIASVVRFPERKVKAAMKELVECGTMSLTADGVYGFPNFWKYQEAPSAHRMRALREREKERHSDASGDVEVTSEVTPRSDFCLLTSDISSVRERVVLPDQVGDSLGRTVDWALLDRLGLAGPDNDLVEREAIASEHEHADWGDA